MVVPTLDSQEAMLLASQLGGQPQPYILQIIVPLAESVDCEKWLLAWESVVASESMLQLVSTPSGIVRVPESKLQCVHHEIEECSWADFFNHSEHTLDGIREKGFPLGQQSQVSLHRTDLFRSPSNRNLIWAFTVHHSLVDGESFRTIFERIVQHYQNLEAGLNQPAEGKNTSRHFLSWADKIKKVHHKPSIRYFETQKSEFEPLGVLSDCLPKISSKGSDSRVHRVSVPIDQELDLQLRACNLPRSSLVHTAWALLLRQVLGVDSVVFGVTRNCRENSHREIGPYANTVPMVVPLNTQRTVLEQLVETRKQWEALKPHENCPLHLSKAAFSGELEGAVFDTLIDISRSTRTDEISNALGDLAREPAQFLQSTDLSFALVLTLEPTMRATLVAQSHLASRETVNELAKTFSDFLRQLCLSPERKLQALFEESNCPAEQSSSYSLDAPIRILERFHATVENFPSQIAISTPGRNWTFEELWESAGKYAAAILRQQIPHDSLIPVIGTRSFELIAAMLGVLRAGRAFLVLSAETPQTRLEQIIQMVEPAIVIDTKKDISRNIPVPSLQILPIDESGQTDDPVQKEHLAYLVSTSGTTGQPKLVMIEHASLDNLVSGYQQILDLQPGDVRYQSTTESSDTFVLEVMLYLSNGATLFIDAELLQKGFGALTQAILNESISVLGLPSSVWKEWVQFLTDEGDLSDLISNSQLRTVICSMERTDPKVLNEWRETLGRNMTWINAYGPSEATCVSNIFQLSPSMPTPVDDIPIGQDLRNVQTYVLNPQGGIVPNGVLGEITIGGMGVARGYFNEGENANNGFGKNPFSNDENARIYHTGDRGYRTHSGDLVFVGREDHQVKIRGQRIELEEIEHLLSRNSSVEDAAAVVIESERNKELVAVYRSAQPVSRAELVEHLQQFLPQSVIPNRFISVDSIPRTPIGKINRKKLLDLASNHLSKSLNSDSSDSQKTSFSGSSLEYCLWKTWCEILGHESIELDDNFFELGGDSLLVMKLVARIEQELGFYLPGAGILNSPTIRGIAKAIQKFQTSNVLALPLQTQGAHPPLFLMPTIHGDAIHWNGVFANQDLNRPVYVIGMFGQRAWGGATTLEGIAELISRTIQSTVGDGTACLAGTSFGGKLAFEVSRQLELRGTKVDKTLIIDAPVGSSSTPISRLKNCRSFLSNLPRWLCSEWSQLKLGNLNHDLERFFNRGCETILRVLPWRSKVPRQVTAAIDLENFPKQQHEKMKIGFDAAVSYKAQPIQSPIVLVRASTRPLLGDFQWDLGWSQLTTSTFQVVLFHGDHNDLYRMQHREQLVRILQQEFGV